MTSPDPIIVVAYDPAWPGQFQTIAQAIREAMGATALRIDHIGSTAVPGLDAKPVIDVQISVVDFLPVDGILTPMQRIGYRWQADNDDLTKRYFREPIGMPRTHIHVRRAGSWSEQLALLFRDYLRAHPDEATQYAEEKYRLAGLYRDERETYTDSKGPIIWEIMRAANRWSQLAGWQPGLSDA